MNIWEIDKLLVFIAFVIPGFIALKTYGLLNPGDSKSSSQQIIDAIAYSCINYAICAWPILFVEWENYSPWLGWIFCVWVLFIFPFILSTIWLVIRKSGWIQKELDFPHPTQKPWDYVFSQREPYWVKVTLKDGTKIAGRYDEKSFTSESPAREIYLQESWIINEEGRIAKKEETNGRRYHFIGHRLY